MINIPKAKKEFKNFLNKYKDQDKLGYKLKIKHTFHVMDNSRIIAESLNLSEEDIKLAELIALLHDIGRFEELELYNRFQSSKFDHAQHGVTMLFTDNIIKKFLDDEKYYSVIKNAIYNHNKLNIEPGLDRRSLIHSQIIRDADKLDNFRVKKEEKIEEIFPKIIKNASEMESSLISKEVFNSIKKTQCVNIQDRKTPLDYWLCVLAFIFDINFSKTFQIIKNKKYVNILLDRFKYNDEQTKKQIEEIRIITNEYVDNKIN